MITFAVYVPVVHHPFINYDDEGYVTDNPHVKLGLTWTTIAWAFTATEQANWHPLTWLSHVLDCEIYGQNASGHHLTSLLIHLINVCLVLLLLKGATGSTLSSFFVAALFAVHPFNVESVAWVAERKNVLSTMFLLLTLAAYGWYAQKPSWKTYFLLAISFAAGLSCKPMLVTVPAVLLLLDYWPLGRIQGWTTPSKKLSIPQLALWRLLWEKFPLVLLSIASSAITLVAQKAGGAVLPFPLIVKIETALSGYALYILKACWPSSFAAYYPDAFDPYLNQHPEAGDYALVAIGALLLLVVTTMAWLQRRSRPYLLMGWLWYVGTLVPVIGLVKVGSQGIADRYAYVPLIGVFIGLVWLGADLARAGTIGARWVVGTGTLIIVVLCSITVVQVSYWKDSLTLFSHAVSVTKNNLIALDKTAVLLLRQGNPNAYRYYQEAARIAPFDPTSHEVVAALADEEGRYQDALQAYEVVIHNSQDRDMLGLAYSNLGVIHARMGEYAQARADARQAAELAPAKIEAQIKGLSQYYSQNPSLKGLIKLCLLFDNAGRLTKARDACAMAATIDSRSPELQKVVDHLSRE